MTAATVPVASDSDNDNDNEELLRQTGSLCAKCQRPIDAQVLRRGDAVVLRKRCPQHGEQEAPIAASAAWYHEMMSYPPVLKRPQPRTEVQHGCPLDCGPCSAHEQELKLPIVPITSACNLDCPICYTHNRSDGAYHMSESELRAILQHLRTAAPEARIINLTGGEPTQHPQFQRLVELCHEEGIHRITISTHGLRFLKDESLLQRLAELQARVILSFDSFEPEVNKELLGGQFLEGKLRVLSLLEKYRVDTTLLPVLCRGKNDHELGALIRLALDKDFIRSIELHTMTFTGQSGADFDRTARLTTYDVLCAIEAQTAGVLRLSDFVPSPAAHPLCYVVTYLLRLTDGRWLPFPRFMDRTDLRTMLAGSLYLEPDAALHDALQDVINRLYAGEIACDEPDLVLASLKAVVGRVFDPRLDATQRLRAAESMAKAVYIHAHMDEETFDSDRIRTCCVGIREPDGRNLPSCAYNILYRRRDARFVSQPAPDLYTLRAGPRRESAG